jgi:hypothetical protein
LQVLALLSVYFLFVGPALLCPLPIDFGCVGSPEFPPLRVQLLPRHCAVGNLTFLLLSPPGPFDRPLPTLFALALDDTGQLRGSFGTRLDALPVTGSDLIASRVAPSTQALRIHDTLR